MKSKQAKSHEFDKKTRVKIVERDHGECIFCMVRYHMKGAGWYALTIKSIMHYIPRSKGGLGIPENGAVGCQWHHEMLDNGNTGRRKEMMHIFKDYLKERYPEWDEKKLVYSKWDF